MKANYCGNIHPKQVQMSANASHIWKRMLAVREHVEQHIQWIVGRGEIDMYQDDWLKSEHSMNSIVMPVKALFSEGNTPNDKLIEGMLGNEVCKDASLILILSFLQNLIRYAGHYHIHVISL